jgi:hypothetical protein
MQEETAALSDNATTLQSNNKEHNTQLQQEAEIWMKSSTDVSSKLQDISDHNERITKKVSMFRILFFSWLKHTLTARSRMGIKVSPFRSGPFRLLPSLHISSSSISYHFF